MKAQRHPPASISSEPSDGPVATARAEMPPHIATAWAPRLGRGRGRAAAASEAGISRAAPTACTTRPAMSSSAPRRACPHSSEPAVKIGRPARNVAAAAERSAMRPAPEQQGAEHDAVGAESTHDSVAVEALGERRPRIDGNATFTIDRSSDDHERVGHRSRRRPATDRRARVGCRAVGWRSIHGVRHATHLRAAVSSRNPIGVGSPCEEGLVRRHGLLRGPTLEVVGEWWTPAHHPGRPPGRDPVRRVRQAPRHRPQRARPPGFDTLVAGGVMERECPYEEASGPLRLRAHRRGPGALAGAHHPAAVGRRVDAPAPANEPVLLEHLRPRHDRHGPPRVRPLRRPARRPRCAGRPRSRPGATRRSSRPRTLATRPAARRSAWSACPQGGREAGHEAGGDFPAAAPAG